ncbi:MAG TPA: hypothetical protein V6C81_13175 [Planktothrix sp.]|jgi:hypothetical protein
MVIPFELVASVLAAALGLVFGLRRCAKDWAKDSPISLGDVFLKQLLLFCGFGALGWLCWQSLTTGFLSAGSDVLVTLKVVLVSAAASICCYCSGNRLAYLIRM